MDQQLSFWWDRGRSFKLTYYLHQHHLPLTTRSGNFVLSYPSQVVVEELSNPRNNYEIQVGYSNSALLRVNMWKNGGIFSPIFALWIDGKDTIESKEPNTSLSLITNSERIKIQLDEYNYLINKDVLDSLIQIRSDDDVKSTIFRILLSAFRHRNGGNSICVDLLKSLVVPCWFEYQQTVNILDELAGQGYLYKTMNSDSHNQTEIEVTAKHIMLIEQTLKSVHQQPMHLKSSESTQIIIQQGGTMNSNKIENSQVFNSQLNAGGFNVGDLIVKGNQVISSVADSEQRNVLKEAFELAQQENLDNESKKELLDDLTKLAEKLNENKPDTSRIKIIIDKIKSASETVFNILTKIKTLVTLGIINNPFS